MEALVRKSFEPGEVIFQQGDTTTELYHILSGRVAISITRSGADVVLAELTAGALFGEMALINGPPRTANATALERVEVNVLSEAVFRRSTVGLPAWALSIAKVLADRLKNTTASLDKLLYEQSHTVPSVGSGAPASINLVPHTLEVSYNPEDRGRLHLSGVLDSGGLDVLMNHVNLLRREKIAPVVLNFSNVVDVHRKALEAVIHLARSSSEAVGKIQLENVQFIADQLTRHEGFEDLLTADQTPLRRVGYGEYLIRQGEEGHEMYVVKSGRFTVSRQIKDKEIILWTAEEGDVIGEMALISGKTRTASVLAVKSSQVYVIDILEFRKNAYHIPKWFMNIIEGLVTRLRDTNKKLDEFVAGELHPKSVSALIGVKIFEDVRAPGSCRLYGTLSEATLKDLRSYVAHRIRQGIRTIHLDVTGVESVDAASVKFLVQLHKYLLNMRGKLQVKGSQKMQFPVEF